MFRLFIRIITKLSAALNVDDEQFLSASNVLSFPPTQSLSYLFFFIVFIFYTRKSFLFSKSVLRIGKTLVSSDKTLLCELNSFVEAPFQPCCPLLPFHSPPPWTFSLFFFTFIFVSHKLVSFNKPPQASSTTEHRKNLFVSLRLIERPPLEPFRENIKIKGGWIKEIKVFLTISWSIEEAINDSIWHENRFSLFRSKSGWDIELCISNYTYPPFATITTARQKQQRRCLRYWGLLGWKTTEEDEENFYVPRGDAETLLT